MAEGNQPTALRYGGRSVRLKWHKLRRAPDDPPFARSNLKAGLRAGASLEVDLQLLACRRFICLHDARLEGETTGAGLVSAIDADAVARLEMLAAPGQPPILLEELVEIVRTSPVAPSARVQLDLKNTAAQLGDAACRTFAATVGALAGRFILSGCDWDAVTRLGGDVPGLAIGYDPTDDPGISPTEALARVGARAAEADTIYLHRDVVRAAQEQGEPLVARLRDGGHHVDCWTIDHGTAVATADLLAAIAAGCDQITTNTASAWATARLHAGRASS
jgi:glycerophosphoryl diester phosphodiesterase